MSKHASSSSTSYGAWALLAWLAALALFLIWLGWVLFSVSPAEEKAEGAASPVAAQNDPGTVLDNLPAQGSLAAPSMPFTASQEYVLTGAGLRLEEVGECTALLLADDGALLACGTRSGKVLRQIAVSPEAEGGGACAEVVSALLQDATAHGVPHPFLFTAPGKSGLFQIGRASCRERV
mgnify:CR=1 FL=1